MIPLKRVKCNCKYIAAALSFGFLDHYECLVIGTNSGNKKWNSKTLSNTIKKELKNWDARAFAVHNWSACVCKRNKRWRKNSDETRGPRVPQSGLERGWSWRRGGHCASPVQRNIQFKKCDTGKTEKVIFYGSLITLTGLSFNSFGSSKLVTVDR